MDQVVVRALSRWGAALATNAVQIAEVLVERGLVRARAAHPEAARR